MLQDKPSSPLLHKTQKLKQDPFLKGIDDLLTIIGLTKNQSRVYLEILQRRKSTASELCTITGIRDSKIYGILTKLEQIGLIIVQVAIPKLYYAVPPQDSLSLILQKFSTRYNRHKQAIKELKIKLTSISETNSQTLETAYVIKGLPAIEEYIQSIIEQAEEEIRLVFPSKSIFFKFKTLLQERARQEHALTIKVGLFHTEYEEILEDQYFFTLFPVFCLHYLLVIDTQEVLIVSKWETPEAYALYTNDLSLVEKVCPAEHQPTFVT